MSMIDEMGMMCPRCGEKRRLAVQIETWAVITDGGTDTYHDDCPDSSHEWGDSSPCRCAACGWSGTVADAESSSSSEWRYVIAVTGYCKADSRESAREIADEVAKDLADLARDLSVFETQVDTVEADDEEADFQGMSLSHLKLFAIRARIHSVSESPALAMFGLPKSDTSSDILHILNSADPRKETHE